MIKSISFIVLTQFFHFNEIKILRQPGYFICKLNKQCFFYSVHNLNKSLNNLSKHFNFTNLADLIESSCDILCATVA